jgi:membrane protein DedA with SNARE-associated domain
MIIEGDAILFTAAFLTQQGFFDFWGMSAIVSAGVITGDLLWYQLGVHVQTMTSRVAVWARHITQPFDAHIQDKLFCTLFVSKFMYGIHHPILMRIGMKHISIRKFLKDDIVASLGWIVVVGGLGFFAGSSFSSVQRKIRFMEVGLLVSLVAFVAISWLVGWMSKKILYDENPPGE